jgi:small subunit ribosomal protein S4
MITLSEKAKKFDFVCACVAKTERSIPSYLSANDTSMEYKYVRYPSIGEVPYPFTAEFNLVIELYSR